MIEIKNKESIVVMIIPKKGIKHLLDKRFRLLAEIRRIESLKIRLWALNILLDEQSQQTNK